MKYRVAELCGAQLDAAVAKAQGNRSSDGMRDVAADTLLQHGVVVPPARYSSEWAHGGPIVERERIAILPWTEANAVVWMPGGNDVDWTKSGPVIWWARADEVVMGYIEECPEGQGHYIRDGYGPTPLIAAMRAYVLSKFEEEVELP